MAFEFDYLQTEDKSVVVMPLKPDYHPGLASIASGDKEHLSKFDEPFWDMFNSVDSIQSEMSIAERHNSNWMTILGRGLIVGAIYCQYLNGNEPQYGIGYWVHSEQTGNGYAKSAVNLISNHIIKEGLSNSIIAYTRDDNHISRLVLIGAGFKEQVKISSSGAKHDYYKYEKNQSS